MDLLFLGPPNRWGGGSDPLPGRLPPGKTRYPLYRWLNGPQGRSGWAENLVPNGIQSRTVQPVVSRTNICNNLNIQRNVKFRTINRAFEFKYEAKILTLNYLFLTRILISSSFLQNFSFQYRNFTRLKSVLL